MIGYPEVILFIGFVVLIFSGGAALSSFMNRRIVISMKNDVILNKKIVLDMRRDMEHMRANQKMVAEALIRRDAKLDVERNIVAQTLAINEARPHEVTIINPMDRPVPVQPAGEVEPTPVKIVNTEAAPVPVEAVNGDKVV